MHFNTFITWAMGSPEGTSEGLWNALWHWQQNVKDEGLGSPRMCMATPVLAVWELTKTVTYLLLGSTQAEQSVPTPSLSDHMQSQRDSYWPTSLGPGDKNLGLLVSRKWFCNSLISSLCCLSGICSEDEGAIPGFQVIMCGPAPSHLLTK